jgi:class 3 adenylate cyclase
MDLARFNALLLESVGVGLAVLEPETLIVRFANRRFQEWFGGVIGRPLAELVAAIDDDVRGRLAGGGSVTLQHEVKPGRRAIALGLQLSRAEQGDTAVVIVEAQNVSKLRELEYMVESYAQMVEKQNRTLRREKERAEKLLLNIMPRTVYEEIKAFGVAAPQRYETASILLLDFVGFTQMAVSREPTALVSELNDLFTAFDRIAEQFGCERIKTAGDAYMAVSGVPEPSPDHALNIAKAALLFRRYLEKRNQSREPRWLCRIGIGTGPVVGSIVGIQKYVYDIFGPGVNLAARLETLCGPMEILLSEATRRLVAAEFRTAERGLQDLRGFGPTPVFTLEASLDALPFEP